MKSLTLFKEFDLAIYIWSSWDLETHTHTFFEIISIQKGSGIHHLNNYNIPYRDGSIFVLIPGDTHSFTINEKTTFGILTFNKIYLGDKKKRNFLQEKYSTELKNIHLGIQQIDHSKSDLISDTRDHQFANSIIAEMINEFRIGQISNSSIIHNLIFILLRIIERNLKINQPLLADFINKKISLDKLTSYIHQNILDRRKLSVLHLSKQFNLSKNYIGEYFKRHTGIPLSKYIEEYRINLIKTKLRNTDMSISEIAFQYGYTDESHLNKSFKKKMNLTTSAYRKSKKSRISNSFRGVNFSAKVDKY